MIARSTPTTAIAMRLNSRMRLRWKITGDGAEVRRAGGGAYNSALRQPSDAGNRMEFSTKSGNPEKQRTGCVVVGVFEGGKLSEAARAVDAASGGFVAGVLRRGDLDAKPGATLMLHHVPKVPAERVLLVSLGKEKDLQEAPYRVALAGAA